MRINPLLNTDSYKFSHFKQYPEGTEQVYSYIESRGGQYHETMFLGLQYFIREYLLSRFNRHDIDEAEEMALAHGEPFNREGWQYILDTYNGFMPVTIRAVPEGTVVPVSHVLCDITNNGGAKTAFVTSFLETAMLRAVWYMSTVGTREFNIRKSIQKYLRETADPEALKWIGVKHNDFGARGASSYETAMLGGIAHLAVFTGTDNVPALLGAKQYYNSREIAGYSIPAAEHSTMTSWGGRDGEIEAMRNMVTQFGKPGALLAVVSDSYDIWNAVNNYWCGDLLKQVKDSGATVVIRPDSGDPVETPIKVIEAIMNRVGFTLNSKGYKMLPKYFKVIQGDGVDEQSITQILYNLKDKGISTDNIAFGMGGAMLQKVDRDTQKFAMKCSAIKVKGEWRDVFKDPVTDPGKASKKGLLDLIREGNKFTTIRQGDFGVWGDRKVSMLRVVYNNGKHYGETSLSDIRENVEFELAARGY